MIDQEILEQMELQLANIKAEIAAFEDLFCAMPFCSNNEPECIENITKATKEAVVLQREIHLKRIAMGINN